jgi:arylsulfatase
LKEFDLVATLGSNDMDLRRLCSAFIAALVLALLAATPAFAQQKPNILFIMGDDIGWMQPSIYHRGLMVGETPNIDRIGNEGAIFMTTTPSRAAPPGATPSSPACIRCARA